MNTLRTSLLAACTSAGLLVGVNAATTIGSGTGILSLAGANNQVDTPTDGNTDQSRQNVDQTLTAVLGPGTYTATTWTYRAGQTGSVIPYLAVLTGPNAYQVIAAGSQVDISVFDPNLDITSAFGGAQTFTLTVATEVFAGIGNPSGAGIQNPIFTNLSHGMVDHDNNADGNINPVVVGGAIENFGHGDLPRTYAFSIEVDLVPEPSSGLLAVLGLGTTLCGLRRRR